MRAEATADERQVVIAMNAGCDTAETMAVGDSWAMRRILDNLLANAVRLTPPGGTVSVSVNRSEDSVTASVSDTGRGLPPEVTQDFRQGTLATDGGLLPTTGGVGLALSNRLARAMDGSLTAQNRAGSGATVSLSLPAA